MLAGAKARRRPNSMAHEYKVMAVIGVAAGLSYMGGAYGDEGWCPVAQQRVPFTTLCPQGGTCPMVTTISAGQSQADQSFCQPLQGKRSSGGTALMA
jgi:hypothetical protein